jgi:hypothetical protein
VAALATPTELAGFLQADLDTYSATQALDHASQAIRDHCGWNISQETVTGKVLDSDGSRSLWLPTLLLTAVGPVVENGVTLTVLSGYDWTEYGRLIRAGRWPNQARSVTVTYTHGYAVVPESVKGVCLAVAGRRYQNPEGRRSYTVGGISESFAVPSTGQIGFFYDTELTDLEKYKLEHVG